MSAHDPAGQLDLEILSAEVALFLAQVPVAERIGVKLSRQPAAAARHHLLVAFNPAEQAKR